MLFILLLLELAALYFLSRWVTNKLYIIFLLLFRSKTVSTSLLTFFLFPGTVIHELGHLFTAEILGVRTGKLTLVPESLDNGHIRSGSVMIAETDPFRRYTIGLAPVLVGLVVSTALSFWASSLLVSIQQSAAIINNPSLYLLFFVSYLLFTISNSMFSSPEDLKGFTGFAIVLGMLVTAGYIAGIRIGVTGTLAVFVNRAMLLLLKTTGIVLVLNCFLLFCGKLTQTLLQNMLKIRIVEK